MRPLKLCREEDLPSLSRFSGGLPNVEMSLGYQLTQVGANTTCSAGG